MPDKTTRFAFITALTLLGPELFSNAYAADLEIGHKYRLGITLDNIKGADTKPDDKSKVYVAPKNSKFTVLSTSESPSHYIVQFTRIYSDEEQKDVKWVVSDKLYLLPKKVADSLDITSVVTESLTGLTAGPLMVPFKYRLDDKSLTGDAEVGVYAGVTFEPGCTKFAGGWCFRITPLLSAGLSQVSVSDGKGAEENKTAVTISAGFLVTGWADLNIGFVYGQDRTGDTAWEHEGEGWLSFMVGWQL